MTTLRCRVWVTKRKLIVRYTPKNCPKNEILSYTHIFVVRKSYKTQKAQDLVGLVLFLLLYLVFCTPCGIFEFRSCILTWFSKNRTRTDDFVLIPAWHLQFIIAETLVKNGYALYYYKPDDSNELEFLIEKNGEVVPVEVKAGNTATKSLNRFIEAYKPSAAYKIVDGNVGVSDVKLTVPHYMAMFL